MDNDDPRVQRRNYKHGFPKTMTIRNVSNQWENISVHIPRTFFRKKTGHRIINTQGIKFEIFYTPEHPENDTAACKAVLKFQAPTTYDQVMILHNILHYFAHNNQQVLQQLNDLMTRQIDSIAYLNMWRPNPLPRPPPPLIPLIDLTSKVAQTSKPRTSTAMMHPYMITGGGGSQIRLPSMSIPHRNTPVGLSILGLRPAHQSHNMSTGYISGTPPTAHLKRFYPINFPCTITSDMEGRTSQFQPGQNANQGQETQTRTKSNNIFHYPFISSLREQSNNCRPIQVWNVGRDLLNRPNMAPNMMNRINVSRPAHTGSTSQHTRRHENILYPHPHQIVPKTATNYTQHGNAPKGTPRDSTGFQPFPTYPFHISNDSVPTVNINHYPTSNLPVYSKAGASCHRPQNLSPAFNAQLIPPFSQRAQVGICLPVQPLQSQVAQNSFPLAEKLNNVAKDQNLIGFPQVPPTIYNERNIDLPNYSTSQYQGNNKNRMIFGSNSQSLNSQGNATNHCIIPNSNFENTLNRQFNLSFQPLINRNNGPRNEENPLIDGCQYSSDTVTGFVPGSVQPNTTANNEPSEYEPDFNPVQVQTVKQNVQSSVLHQSISFNLNNFSLENYSDPVRSINEQPQDSKRTAKREDQEIWTYECSKKVTSNEIATDVPPKNEPSSSQEATGNNVNGSPQFSLSSDTSDRLVIDEGVFPWKEDRECDAAGPAAGNIALNDHNYY